MPENNKTYDQVLVRVCVFKRLTNLYIKILFLQADQILVIHSLQSVNGSVFAIVNKSIATLSYRYFH